MSIVHTKGFGWFGLARSGGASWKDFLMMKQSGDFMISRQVCMSDVAVGKTDPEDEVVAHETELSEV